MKKLITAPTHTPRRGCSLEQHLIELIINKQTVSRALAIEAGAIVRNDGRDKTTEICGSLIFVPQWLRIYAQKKKMSLQEAWEAVFDLYIRRITNIKEEQKCIS